MKALAPAIGLIQTCVFLGGTIVVFGKCGIMLKYIAIKSPSRKIISIS